MTDTAPRSVEMATLLTEALTLLDRPTRQFIAFAGAPGSGKSTTVETLEAQINAQHPGAAAILPMDGYHYDDAVLKARGRHPWKGAPDTFDVGGLASTLLRLKTQEEPEVAVPVFDRDLEISRGSARLIPRDVPLILVEGNYLLLDQAPWTRLHPLFDVTVLIDVPEDELARRLRARWEGYSLTDAQILAKLEDNDMPNGRVVMQNSIVPDFRLYQ